MIKIKYFLTRWRITQISRMFMVVVNMVNAQFIAKKLYFFFNNEFRYSFLKGQ